MSSSYLLFGDVSDYKYEFLTKDVNSPKTGIPISVDISDN